MVATNWADSRRTNGIHSKFMADFEHLSTHKKKTVYKSCDKFYQVDAFRNSVQVWSFTELVDRVICRLEKKLGCDERLRPHNSTVSLSEMNDLGFQITLGYRVRILLQWECRVSFSNAMFHFQKSIYKVLFDKNQRFIAASLQFCQLNSKCELTFVKSTSSRKPIEKSLVYRSSVTVHFNAYKNYQPVLWKWFTYLKNACSAWSVLVRFFSLIFTGLFVGFLRLVSSTAFI